MKLPTPRWRKKPHERLMEAAGSTCEADEGFAVEALDEAKAQELRPTLVQGGAPEACCDESFEKFF